MYSDVVPTLKDVSMYHILSLFRDFRYNLYVYIIFEDDRPLKTLVFGTFKNFGAKSKERGTYLILPEVPSL